jgi:hypothetical protein
MTAHRMERVNGLADAPPSGEPVRFQARYPALRSDVHSDPAEQSGRDTVLEVGLAEILVSDALCAIMITHWSQVRALATVRYAEWSTT